MTCILWVGEDSVHLRLLEVSGAIRIERAASVEETCTRRADALAHGKTGSAWAGVTVDAARYAATMQTAEFRDGPVETIGFADTLALAGPLLGVYASCMRVGGIIAAPRKTTGSPCRSDDGAVVSSEPEVQAGLAALAQLRVRRLVAHTESFDAVTSVVAHRLDIELTTVGATAFTGIPMVYPACELAAIVNGDEKGLVINETVTLHTAVAQVRLLASKEPDPEMI